MNAAWRILGKEAFRKYFPENLRRSPVSKALFEVWSVNLDKLSDEQIRRLEINKIVLMNRFSNLMYDSAFMEAISYSTGDSKRVQCRFKKIEKIIMETIGA